MFNPTHKNGYFELWYLCYFGYIEVVMWIQDLPLFHSRDKQLMTGVTLPLSLYLFLGFYIIILTMLLPIVQTIL